jgi:RND family efflux transporter MFP subunit
MKYSKVLIESTRILLPIGILAAGVLAFAALAAQRQAPPRVEPRESIPLVEAMPVEPHDGTLDIRADGLVVPLREITISAEVGGRITRKAEELRAGHFVTAGTRLVEIDPRVYRLEVERLGEEVKQAEANIKELEVEVENSRTLLALAGEEAALRRRDLDRMLQLRTQNAASESSVDEARRLELMARNSIATLQNQLRSHEAARTRLASAQALAATKLQQAELDLEKSQVRAPIDGVIVRESIEENTFVQPGTALFAIEDVSAVEVRFSLRMEELDWIWQQRGPANGTALGDADGDYQLPRTPATVTYRLGGREYQWQGVLWRYEGIGLDEATRMVPCRVLVREPRQFTVSSAAAGGAGPRALMRGMFVRVTIHAQPQTKLLRVPERAVLPGNTVWSVRDGKLNQVRLRDMMLVGDFVIVPEHVTGLRTGDVVVTTPLPVATEGMAVQTEPLALATETRGP